MPLTKLSLSNPVAVAVALLLAILFGLISLNRLPIQLTPEIEKPEITIKTNWRAASPREIEAEIIEQQEEVLRSLPGMTKLLARARRGQGEITMTFQVGTNLERSLIEILNRLNRIPSYPEDADEPIISSVGGNSRAIAWFIIKPGPGNDRHIATYQDFVEEVIQSRFERVPGVALSEVRGGREEEVRITFDPYKAAHFGIELPEAAGLAGGAKDTSAGDTDVGKRRYAIRFEGAYSASELQNLIVDWRDGQPIYLKDIAEVDIKMVDRASFVIQNGEPAMAVNAHREHGVNMLRVMAGLKEGLKELEEGPLKRANLTIEQVYDETIYIDRSIEMVANNLALGVCFAIICLWWFLRKFRATFIVALAIPASLLATFVIIDAAGRTLNVISLAGLAFAVGMVLDAAIIALENIVRLREKGLSPTDAAQQGTNQVWGALLASTATTVAIFLPIVFLQDEAGQLFADLALTLAVAIVFSLITAVTILPTAARKWLITKTLRDPHERFWNGLSRFIIKLTSSTPKRIAWIMLLLALPIGLTVQLWPKADYLPEGNRNLVFASVLAPPGSNIDLIESEMGTKIVDFMAPHLDGTAEPQVLNYFFVSFGTGSFLGARTVDATRTKELVPLLNRVLGNIPDTIGFAFQSSLFGGFGEGRSIDIDIQGRDVESLLKAAMQGFLAVRQAVPGASVRPFPGLDLAQPEYRLIPDEHRIAEAGWNRETMAQIIRALGDGLFLGDYFDGEKRMDVILRATPWSLPEELLAMPLATPDSGVLPLSELVHFLRTAGPEEIRRLNKRRTITLQVKVPDTISLEEALAALKEKVEPLIEAELPEDGSISYSGTADKLETAINSMSGTFLLAIAILYLLMSALFRSFTDSLLVLLAIPLAGVGGVIALTVLNMVQVQPLDLLTMIGFIILLGLVVNNAILLVHQTRSAERDGHERDEAVAIAVRTRLRPIFMSTLTSIFGMLPLLLIPGAGTELYRGLAAVIVGGMAVSTLFTLILLPSLLGLGRNRKVDQQHAA